jgi:hypothetical protein
MLTINFLPYSEIENLSSYERIKKIMNIVKEKKILVLEGRLKREEETELIKITMAQIDKGFTGIELAVIYPEEEMEKTMMSRLKTSVVGFFLGNRQGMTIIGPASIVKEIKKDPNNIELLTMDTKESLPEKPVPKKKPKRRLAR